MPAAGPPAWHLVVPICHSTVPSARSIVSTLPCRVQARVSPPVGHTAPVLRLAATHDVVAFVRGVPADLLARRARALGGIYERAVNRRPAVELHPVATATDVAVVVLRASAEGAEPASSGTWGVLYDDTGALSPATAAAWARQPNADVRGCGIAWTSDARGLRIASTAAAPHTLWRHEAGGTAVLATKGLAAVILAGTTPRARREVLADLVSFDYVLGADGGLQDVAALPEATAADVDVDGVRLRSWWPLAQRWAAGPTTSAQQVAVAIEDAVRGLGDVPGARLGLTAGRDSAVVGGALVRAGTPVPCFTLGMDGAEVAGARETATRLGLDYETVPVTNAVPSAQWSDIERVAPWIEGLDTPRPVAAGELMWPAAGVQWVTGHGGEVGRSFYWRHPDESLAEVISRLCARAGPLLPAAREGLRERLRDRLHEAGRLRSAVPDRLDVFYATERMHKWINRSWPFVQVSGMTVPMLEPPVVRLLADLPLAGRADGSSFAEIVALLAPGTPSPLRPQPAPRAPRRGPLRRRAEALRAKVLRPAVEKAAPDQPVGAGAGEPTGDGPALLQLLAAEPAVAEACRDLMGETWWQMTTARIATSARHQRFLWNALGWVAWERSLEQLASSLPAD